MNRICRSAVALLLATAALGTNTNLAQAAFLNTTDRGWYQQGGASNNPGADNYIAGFESGIEYRDFFVFDLTSVTGTITSASLSLANPSNALVPTATFELFDVSTSISSLTGGTGGVPAFDDLGTGTVLATHPVDFHDAGTTVIVDLNGDGLAYLNAHPGGKVAIGGRLFTNVDYIFGFTNHVPPSPADGNTQLIYTAVRLSNVTPAPPGAVLFGIGLIGLTGFRALRRRTQGLGIA